MIDLPIFHLFDPAPPKGAAHAEMAPDAARPAFSGRSVTVTSRQVGQWRIKMVTDRFDAQRYCNYFRGPVSVERGVAEFKLGRAAYSPETSVRVGEAEAQPARVFAIRAAGLGAKVYYENLDDPGRHAIFIPVSDLRSGDGFVAAVAVRPTRGGPYRNFGLGGLREALDVGVQLGCGPDASPQKP